MSLSKRLSFILRAKAHKRLDSFEDIGANLDHAYLRQLELLSKVRRGLVHVAASRKRVEIQATQLAARSETLTRQAERAIALDREDLAREALTRRADLAPQLADLIAQREQLLAEETKLITALNTLERKVAAFRIQKETIKAKHAAAQAQVRVGESLAGISADMDDLGNTLARAEDQTHQLQARAAAVDELTASGVLDDGSGLTGDPLTRELDAVTAEVDIEAELAQLKARPTPRPHELD